MRSLQFILILSLALSIISSTYTPRYLGTFNTENPAFFANDNNHDLSAQSHVVISSFSGMPWTSGKIWLLENLGGQLKSASKITTRLLTDGLAWPNLISVIPKSTFGINAILIPDGFLPPGKSNGAIKIMTLDDSNNKKDLFTITQSLSDTFYHTGLWVDLNGDGKLDLITARTTESGIFSKTFTGELLWLENPGSLSNTPWIEHKLADGPDVMINIVELDNDASTIEVVAAEFFGKQISLNVIDKASGQLKYRRIIDSQTAAAYNIYSVDINNDGKLELLASNHDGSSSVSAVWCYQVPSDLQNGVFQKTQLASGFVTSFSILPGAASPGFVYAVYPQVSMKGKERPYLLIAGDGSNQAYFLSPKSTNGFDYDMVVLKDLGGTVGSIGYGDYDNDGWLDFLVPNYDKGYVEVYTFAPATQQVNFLALQN